MASPSQPLSAWVKLTLAALATIGMIATAQINRQALVDQCAEDER